MSDVLFLFGVLISLAAAALWLLLPVVSLIRSSRMSRELAEIKGRLAALEAAFQGGVSPPRPREVQVQQPPVAEPASVAEPAPAAAVPREAPALQAVPPPPPSPPPVMSQPVEPAAAVAANSRAAVAAESTLEEAIGGRLMLWVGAIVLVLGVAFFLKYAFDNEWITESMRGALGGRVRRVALVCVAGLCVAGLRVVGWASGLVRALRLLGSCASPRVARHREIIPARGAERALLGGLATGVAAPARTCGA